MALLATLAPRPAAAWTGDSGQVTVIEDVTGAIHDQSGMWGPDRLCRETAKVFYACHGDAYDVLVVFTTKDLDMIHNVQQGTPVQNAIAGIGYRTFDSTAVYGSDGRLEQCVSMSSLGKLPDDPDGDVPSPFIPWMSFGVTGVELLGHELGHRWLLGIEYDKGDGAGPQHALRGFESDAPNMHYNARADSGSVMYGNFITEDGDGAFTSCGGERGYSPLDQYLMGLRAQDETPPIFFVDDGTLEGDPAVAKPAGQCDTITGTRVDVSVEDVVRAMGTRVPGAAEAQNHWRVAFVLVTEAGVDASAVQVAKVDRYRARFEAWFPWATEDRGSVDTTLAGNSCTGGGESDGGTPDGGFDGGFDGGPEDAGDVTDGGPGDADAGLPDAGAGTDRVGPCLDDACADGGDPGLLPADAGCDCSTGGGGSAALLPALLGLALLLRRRSRGVWWSIFG